MLTFSKHLSCCADVTFEAMKEVRHDAAIFCTVKCSCLRPPVWSVAVLVAEKDCFWCLHAPSACGLLHRHCRRVIRLRLLAYGSSDSTVGVWCVTERSDRSVSTSRARGRVCRLACLRHALKHCAVPSDLSLPDCTRQARGDRTINGVCLGWKKKLSMSRVLFRRRGKIKKGKQNIVQGSMMVLALGCLVARSKRPCVWGS